MSYYISILTFAAINLIAVLAVFTLTGLTGLFSFGQASFMAIGAYTAGILVIKFGVPFPIAIFIAILFGIIAALIIGLPTLKLRRDFISLVTFGFGEAIIAILNNTTSVTGGATGLIGIPLYTTTWLAVASALIVLFLVINFKCSKYGRMCIALKADELSAKSMGINVNRVKLATFLFSAVLTTYAGVLYGFYTTYVDPGLFGWTKSAEWIIMVFFGGLSSISGAVFAAIVLGTLPELLRFAAEWRIVIYCAIVLIIISYRPIGVFGEYEINIKTLKKDIFELFTKNRKSEGVEK